MKNILKQLTICSVWLFAFSCIKADIPQGDTSSEEGVLAISPVSIVADVVEKGKSATRAEDVSPADFVITITRVSTGEVAHTCKYSEFPAQGVGLIIGDYNFYIESMPVGNAAWEEIHYSASRNFSIKKEETTTLNDIVCKVTNILVSVNFTERMKNAMDNDGNVKVEFVRNNPLVWKKAETRRGGFKAAAESNTLTWDFEGYIGEFYVEQTDIITGVKAGEHRILTFDIVPAEEGQVDFGFSVTVECTTVNLNENVEVEEPIVQPLPAPVAIKLSDGLSFDEPTVVYLGAKSAEKVPFPTDHIMTLEVPNGINVANLSVVSSYSGLTSLSTSSTNYISNGISLFDDLTSLQKTYINTRMGITTGESIRGTTEYVLNVSNIVGLYLHNSLLNSGAPLSSTMQITLTGGDNKGNVLTKTFTYELKKENKPASVFTLDITGDGIATPKVIAKSATAGATVQVLIEASAGIKGLVVNMESTDPTFDNTVRVMSPLDLFDPTKETDLIGLGLLDERGVDAIRDQTSYTFDISSFLPLIAGFISTDDITSKFHLTVTDNEDRVITKSIVLTITNN